MRPAPRFEFHISRAARERYDVTDTLFSVTGNVVFAGLAASRALARRVNEVRDARRHPERALHAAALHSMGLIDEALHLVVARYREQRDPQAIAGALAWFEARLGPATVNRILEAFVAEFPASDVHRGRRAPRAWLAESSGGVPHREVAFEELMLLWLANANPAFLPFAEFFDDRELVAGTPYRDLTMGLREYFSTRPTFGPANENLVDLLRAPALAAPDSLAGQLRFMREHWTWLLGDFLDRFAQALDTLDEEEVAIWMRFHPPGAAAGPPPPGFSGADAIPSFRGRDAETERFSRDEDWMPRTVLIAKSVIVWLDQLARQYGRAIERLDQIPDEELETLARRGFNALWLIGVWERSRASQRIKQLCGNPEAAASAYSLHDYLIAGELGGEGALANLRERARARGIRLASDMVPNHMAIDSRWVVEHPDWFLSLGDSPFPAYRFDGPDLSRDGRVEIKIEDHYYDRSDAAVVFRRVDRASGSTRFLYHGNDGTSFPWNDTAQLDYLKPEVREGVIQTILHVARQFPIVRFDAAMTLAKKHFQRLWYPPPGSGGAIPSRAERGMGAAAFDAAMPVEFWRDVVDRCAAEAPGTLLLAEAFWLMEGYFVRTLGLHRVYNSAFMNMLRDEENANYRSVLKNTLEFDPEVLKRYVNFMNNPDERTAVDQFGKGDKYFGVCTLMVTLPGLPMFGHGQVEGLAEKYGMEYRRAYHDEAPDPWMIARHEREIAPLLHRRALFAEAHGFALYDCFGADGRVNEDVFAYSNRRGAERALVVYHNRYAHASGWIRESSAFAEPLPGGGRRLARRTLGESLGLSGDPAMLAAWRDARTGNEHLRRAAGIARDGLQLELGAYACHVLLDWRDIRDDGARPWGALCDRLEGRGVPSLDEALRALELEPVHAALAALLAPEVADAIGARPSDEAGAVAGIEGARRRARVALAEVRAFARGAAGEAAGLGAEREWRGDAEAAARGFERRLEAARRLPALERALAAPWPAAAHAVLPGLVETRETEPARGDDASPPAARDDKRLAPDPDLTAPAGWGSVVAWAALEALGRAVDPDDPGPAAVRLFDALRLREPIARGLMELGLEERAAWLASARIRAGFAHATPRPGLRHEPPTNALTWIHDPDVAWAIGVHEHEGVRYFVQEPFEQLLWWMVLPALLDSAAEPQPDLEAPRALVEAITACARAARAAGYRVESLLDSGPSGARSPA